METRFEQRSAAGACCMARVVPFFFDLVHRRHVRTHMLRNTRIPPPTPPPIAAATELEIEAESTEGERCIKVPHQSQSI